jgi:hypothetical protein
VALRDPGSRAGGRHAEDSHRLKPGGPDLLIPPLAI